MGLTVLKVKVGNVAKPKALVEVEFVIDSGAIYSVVQKSILKKLGIKPVAEEEYRLMDLTKIVRKKGIALFRYGDKIGGADVIFGEKGDMDLLGATTLEALGLALDPIKREIKPMPLIMA